MENLIQRIIQKTTGLVTALGLAGIIAGCDDDRKIVMKKIKIDGPVEIYLIRHELPGRADLFNLEVYDNAEQLKVKLVTNREYFGRTLLVDEEGKQYYVVSYETLGYIKDKK